MAALRHVRGLDLRIRGLVDSLFAGEYPSVFRGRGLEFSHLREYTPGDDVRAIDWKVTARRGAPYVREFVEERELTVLLVVDCSGSTTCGTGARSLREIALELSSVLALTATRGGDRVGLVLFTDEVERFLPPGSGRRHALNLMLELHSFRPRGSGTRPSGALELVSRALKPRTIVFLSATSSWASPSWRDSPTSFARFRSTTTSCPCDSPTRVPRWSPTSGSLRSSIRRADADTSCGRAERRFGEPGVAAPSTRKRGWTASFAGWGWM